MEGSCCVACLVRVTRGRQGPLIEDSGYGPGPVDGFVSLSALVFPLLGIYIFTVTRLSIATQYSEAEGWAGWRDG